MPIFRRARPGMLMALILLLAPVNARADFIVSSTSVNGLGTFSGFLSYTAINSTTGALTVSLTNTTSIGDGGYLTAFALNNPFDRITGAAMISTDPDFSVTGGPGYQDTVPSAAFGTFDLGASVAPNSTSGLAAGQTASFLYLLTGTSLNSLTTADFLTTLSTGPSTLGEQFFIAQFEQIRADNAIASDEAAATVQTPEPGSLSLAALGLLGLAGYRRRRARQA